MCSVVSQTEQVGDLNFHLTSPNLSNSIPHLEEYWQQIVRQNAVSGAHDPRRHYPVVTIGPLH